ncbi:MAG: TraR/DksA C4-type zinc finger protein [Patescibacteria group bacterium]|nr:TraR/DksA C4-type zinc finger protein [Patescibacteria group bacterium]MDE1944364.1 TraR/DksA C4-type zinc finger protein [Patescibacteria group bacterium]MDE2057928.1 TraR/DksA C4-type zinc finger protein [Patescibacteria group bacterium]
MDTAEAKRKLTEERTRLEGELRSVGRPNPDVPGDWEPLPQPESFEPDPLDRAELLTGQEDNAAILADLEARYASVNEALERIEQGTYGRCEVCGEEIEPARLAADLAATTCTAHK